MTISGCPGAPVQTASVLVEKTPVGLIWFSSKQFNSSLRGVNRRSICAP